MATEEKMGDAAQQGHVSAEGAQAPPAAAVPDANEATAAAAEGEGQAGMEASAEAAAAAVEATPDEGADEEVYRAQEELLEFLNGRRKDGGVSHVLGHGLLLTRAAQQRAEQLLAAATEGTEAVDIGAHQRYFRAGTDACVTELVDEFEAGEGKEFEDGNARRSLARVRDKLVKIENGGFASAMDGRYMQAGFGVAVSAKKLILVSAFAYHYANFDELEGLSFRERQSIHGIMRTSNDHPERNLTPVGAVLYFYPEGSESDIPRYFLAVGGMAKAPPHDDDMDDAGMNDNEKKAAIAEAAALAAKGSLADAAAAAAGKKVLSVLPWDMEYDASTSSFAFHLDVMPKLQELGYYEVPRGVFHLRVYGQAPNLGEAAPSKSPSPNFVIPDPTKHTCICTASFPYPPLSGTAVHKSEMELARARRRRLGTLPVTGARLLNRGGLVPEGYEIFDWNSPEGSKLPLLCLEKANPDEDEAEAKPCIVELAVAFGSDDVPPGFEPLPDADGTQYANLRRCLADGGDSDDEDGKEDRDAEDEPIYLCVRTSNDELELATRGISDIFLRLDKDEKEEEGYEKLDIVPGSLHAMFRVVSAGDLGTSSGAGGLGDGAADGTRLLSGGGDDEDESDMEEDESAMGGDHQDEWDEMEMGGLGKLDPAAMEGGELGECILPTAESKRAELEEAERVAQATRIEGLIENARAEREKLIGESLALQKALVPYMARKKQQAAAAAQAADLKGAEDEAGNGAGADDGGANGYTDSAAMQEKERQYANSLNACSEAKETLRRTRDAYDKVAMDLQTKLDEKEAKACEIRSSFAHFKREIAKAAENSRTGKPIPMRIIRQFEDTEQQKDAEVEKVRLKNINLRSQLRKLEHALHEKEKLAEGLHLIDFEQLKIENQTLNEKIEERNEELHKLRKKTTTTVQVLTHIKEKLQFVQAESVQLKSELGGLDKEVTASRDQLTKSKHARDALRSSNEARKRDQGFVNSTLLVQDFQRRKTEIKALKRQIRDLQQKYSNLTGLQLPAAKPRAAPQPPSNRDE